MDQDFRAAIEADFDLGSILHNGRDAPSERRVFQDIAWLICVLGGISLRDALILCLEEGRQAVHMVE